MWRGNWTLTHFIQVGRDRSSGGEGMSEDGTGQLGEGKGLGGPQHINPFSAKAFFPNLTPSAKCLVLYRLKIVSFF